MNAMRQWRHVLPATAVVVAFAGGVRAADSGAQDAHHHHHHGASAPADGVAKPVAAVHGLPGVTLVREDGTPVRIDLEVGDRMPVVLAFIYTSCTAVCPVTSQVMSQVQKRLGAASSDVKLISVATDPV